MVQWTVDSVVVLGGWKRTDHQKHLESQHVTKRGTSLNRVQAEQDTNCDPWCWGECVTKSKWHTKPEVFTVWPFAETKFVEP